MSGYVTVREVNSQATVTVREPDRASGVTVHEFPEASEGPQGPVGPAGVIVLPAGQDEPPDGTPDGVVVFQMLT